MEYDCIEDHAYAERICPICGAIFCFNCCGNTNVHEGGKYDPDFMNCPRCGHDIYSVPINWIPCPHGEGGEYGCASCPFENHSYAEARIVQSCRRYKAGNYFGSFDGNEDGDGVYWQGPL